MRHLGMLGGVLAAAGFGSVAFADVVYLHDGGRLEGEVRREGGDVVVRVDGGELRLAADAVRRVEERPHGTLERFERRRRALPPEAIPPRVELAVWATARGLHAEARSLWREVLALDPSHARAHRGLDHVQVDGVWLDASAARRARGSVLHGGRWVSEAQAQAEAEAVETFLEREEEAEAEARARARAPDPSEAPEPSGPAQVSSGWVYGPPWSFGFLPVPATGVIRGPRGPTGLRLGLKIRRGAAGGGVVFGPIPRSGRAPAPPVPPPSP